MLLNSTTINIKDWRKQDVNARSSKWKIVLYDLARPWISRRASKLLGKSTLSLLKPALVLPERGFPLETRRRWATKYQPLGGKTILVQGTGTGWDVISWAELRPARIIATDLFSFAESWDEISLFCRQRFDVEVQFIKAPLEDHSFLEKESIDLCASDAVYEHCTDLSLVVQETHRILKADGYVYATYGPMWFCAYGNHFNRGGLENAYNHLLLDEHAYREYLNSFKKEGEDFQSGYRYTELNLFSYLHSSDYLEVFQNSGFIVDELILEISSHALDYLKKFPEEFTELEEKYAERCNRDDFLIKGNFVRLRKKL